MIVFYHQIKTPIDYWCWQEFNLKSYLTIKDFFVWARLRYSTYCSLSLPLKIQLCGYLTKKYTSNP